MDDDFEDVMSVGHGALRFHCYQVGPDDRERAVYVTDWESPGSFIEQPYRCVKCGGPDGFHDPACVVHPDHQNGRSE